MFSTSRQRGALGVGFLSLCLLVPAVTAHAAPITWTLVDVAFGAQCLGDRCAGPGVPGGTASGYFVFDPQNNSVTAWDLTVQGGDTTLFPAYRWSSGDAKSTIVGQFNPGNNGEDRFTFIGEPSAFGVNRERQLRLVVAADALDIVGIAPLIFDYSSDECYNCNPARLVVSGELHGAATPVAEPASLWLLGLSVAWARLRKTPEA